MSAVRIRWKILVVLISISIVPMLAMRWNAHRIVYALAQELGEQAEDALVRQSVRSLKQLVEDHGRVLRRDGDLIEMILMIQAAEIEKRLAGPEPSRNSSSSDGASAAPPTDRVPVSYCRLEGDGTCEPITVTHQYPRWILPKGMAVSETNRIIGTLGGMSSRYVTAARKFPGLFLWQITVLENGIQAIYPGPEVDTQFDGRRMSWYRRIKTGTDVAWNMPVVDPLTLQIVLPVAVPIHGPGGEFIGAAAAMVPVSGLLHENRHIRMISGNITSLLVRPESRINPSLSLKSDEKSNLASEPTSDVKSDATGILIIASEDGQASGHEQWHYHNRVRWLASDAPDALNPVISDLVKRRSGISEIAYRGRLVVMAYSVISAEGTALLLIVPKPDLVEDAQDMERYVQSRFREEMRTTGTILWGVLAGVALLSFVLSRYVTMNIQKLLDGSRRLATGDFSTRIDIRTRDEIGELGRAFNRMVPGLEERVRLKQGIDVASSVQQNLLPKDPPVFPGADIAAVSRYCDETGGDFYDFIALERGVRPGIGIAVGDASGHGISAALLMATARAFLKGRVAAPGSLAEMIGDVNRLLCRDTDVTVQFLTLFYMEMADGAIDWVRAGHDPGILYDPETDAFAELKGEGPAMGIDRDVVYSASRRTGLKTGQIIAVGTDGIWETRNRAGEMFGKKRFQDVIRSQRDAAAREIVDRVAADLNVFRGPAPQLDDVTLVIVKIT